MIGALGELFRHEGSGVERAAVVSDVRGGDYFDDLLAVLGELRVERAATEGPLPRGRRGDPARTATRRPAAATRWRADGRIVDGIRAERELLAPLRERADVVIDTTDLTGARAAAPDRRAS